MLVLHVYLESLVSILHNFGRFYLRNFIPLHLRATLLEHFQVYAIQYLYGIVIQTAAGYSVIGTPDYRVSD